VGFHSLLMIEKLRRLVILEPDRGRHVEYIIHGLALHLSSEQGLQLSGDQTEDGGQSVDQTQQAERPEQSSLTGAAEGSQRVPAKQKHDTAHEAAGGSQGYDDEESRPGRLPNQLDGVCQQPWKPAKIFFGAALLPAVYPLPLHLRWKVRHHRRRSGSMKSISRRLAPHAVACQLCSGNSVTSAPQWWHHSASDNEGLGVSET